MITTRRQLRRDTLKALGDLRILKATNVGDDQRFIDTLNLVAEVDAYRGREVIFTGGTVANLGQMRYVTGSSDEFRALGFGVSLPAATAVGDECEMVNTRGTMYRLADVHDAINQAIRAVGSQTLTPAGSDEQTYARGTAIEVPPEFRTVESVQWLDAWDTTTWRSVPKARRVNGPGWSVDRANRTVVISGDSAWNLNERTIVVRGLAEPSELHDDSDTTTLDPEFLSTYAQALLAKAKFLRMPTPETERTMFALQQLAGSLRRKVVTRRGPFSTDI